MCRGFVGAGAAVLIPAAAGMIGANFPPGKKRTLAFVAVSCGEFSHHLPHCRATSADATGGVVGGSVGMVIAGAFVEYSRLVVLLDLANDPNSHI